MPVTPAATTMRPKPARSKTAMEPLQVATGSCWLGALLVAQSSQGICAILFGDTTDQLQQELADRFPDHILTPVHDVEQDPAFVQVRAFLEDPSQPFSMPLDMHGTPFQERVWQALLAIPAGTTSTYTELARQIGSPKAVRAVANACGANLLAGVVPCHRVIRRDGTLSGYRCGIERKRQLLALEARLAPSATALLPSHG